MLVIPYSLSYKNYTKQIMNCRYPDCFPDNIVNIKSHGTRFWRTFQNIGNRIDMPISSKKQSINIRAKRLLMLFWWCWFVYGKHSQSLRRCNQRKRESNNHLWYLPIRYAFNIPRIKNVHTDLDSFFFNTDRTGFSYVCRQKIRKVREMAC